MDIASIRNKGILSTHILRRLHPNVTNGIDLPTSVHVSYALEFALHLFLTRDMFPRSYSTFRVCQSCGPTSEIKFAGMSLTKLLFEDTYLLVKHENASKLEHKVGRMRVGIAFWFPNLHIILTRELITNFIDAKTC